MKKLLLLLSFFVIIFCVNAQTPNDAAVLQLVSNNSTAIGIQKEQVANLKLSSTYTDAGTQYVYLLQTYKGLPIYNQMLVLAFKDSKLISHAGGLLPNVETNTASEVPTINSTDALNASFSEAGLTAPLLNNLNTISKENGRVLDFGKLEGVSENVTAELMWVPNSTDQSLKLVWQIQVAPSTKSDWWLMQVDAASGVIYNKLNLTVYETFDKNNNAGILANTNFIKAHSFSNVDITKNLFAPPPPTVTSANYYVVPFPYESPAHHALALVNNPWLNAGATNNATTDGWQFDGTTNYDSTKGNNVHAYTDINNANADNGGSNYSARSSTAIPSLTFNFVPNFNQDPTVSVNQNNAITNLFYWNNLMHDVMYQYGFTEPAGNFQTDNISRGGIGNDYVQAEGQDGGGTNNANFATPVDGSRPRMQMYLFDAATTVTLHVNTPASIAGNYNSIESGFSTANKLSVVGPVTAQAVYFNDATGGTHDACTGAPSNSLTGKIAIINRNVCSFIIKVKEAQNAGAKAVIMVNNAPGNPIIMGGTDNTITIPAVMVSDVDGAILAAQLANNENITLSAVSGQRLDGDLDDGVMTHEYMHGISNRLTGGPANTSCLGNAEQGGEGWSDYSSLMMTTNWATATVTDGSLARPIGTYVEGQPTTGAGIRNYPYSTNMTINPLTYANMGNGTIGTEVHNIGEIWCATLWDMTWGIIQQENSINTNLYNYSGTVTGGNSIALKLVLEGMKLQPCSPGYIDARNAILQADINLYNGRHLCSIWTAFAKRGMGYSANQGLSTSATDQTAAFDLPPAVIYSTQPANTSVCTGNAATFTIAISPGAPTTFQWQISTNNGSTWTNISGATAATYTTGANTAANNGNQFRCVGTNPCGSVPSNAAILTVVTASTGGTLSPSTASVCGVTTATGTLTLSGQSGNVVQWEFSTVSATGPWTVFANTTTSFNYNVTQTTYYRALVQGSGCSTSAYSSIATVSILAGLPLTITADNGTTLCVGDPTKLTVNEGVLPPTTATMTQTLTTTNTVITFNFRNNNAYPVTITDLSSLTNFIGGIASVSAYYKASAINGAPGAITTANGWNQFGSASIPSLGTGVVQPFMNNLNLVVPANSTYGILVSSTHPAGANNIIYSNALAQSIASAGGCDIITGANIGYAGGPVPAAPATANRYFIGSVKFNGPVTPVTTGTFTWSPAAGLNTTTGNPVAASPSSTTTYTVTSDNGSGCVRTGSILVTILQRPAITSQPVNTTSCAGSNATFSVTATGDLLNYQWQVSTDNCTTYTNIAGATSSTLTLTGITSAMNGNGYRCIITGTCTPVVTSNCAKLSVNPLPALAITPAGPVCGGVAGINGVLLSTGGAASPPPIPGSATFTSTTSIPVPDNSAAGATSVITATGIPANATVTGVTVTLNMSHTYPGDMIFNLKAPNATIANLYKYNGGTFTGAASGPATWGWYGAKVTTGGVAFKTIPAPYVYNSSTTFAPDLLDAAVTGQAIQNPTGYTSAATSLSQLYSTPNGAWTLAMCDGGAGDVGTLSGWSIKIDYTTPDPNGAPITYTWSPAAGLYTNATATTPYVAGSLTPSVYAAPAALTTYTVTATTAATGCSNTGTVVVNYTPPAPTVTPNPVTMCLGDAAVKLYSSSSVASSQTFTTGTISLPVPDNNATGVISTINVSGIPANAIVTSITATLNMPHTYPGDMIFNLKAPNAVIANLYKYNGGTGTGAASVPTAGWFGAKVTTGGVAFNSIPTPYIYNSTTTFSPDLLNAAIGGVTIQNPTGYISTATSLSQLYSTPNGTWTLAMADGGAGDVGTLTGWSLTVNYVVGVPTTAAVWSPATGLYTNAAATNAYVAGTPLDTVYTKPPSTTVYSVNVNSAGSTAPTTATMTQTPAFVVTNITYNFRNNNPYPVVLSNISGMPNTAGATNVSAFYNTAAINGLPGAITAANGWNQIGSTSSITAVAGVVQPFLTGLNLTVPPGATYGILLQAVTAAGGVNLVMSGTLTQTIASAGGCDIITGANIGYTGNTAVVPAAPTLTPYYFIGSVGFVPVIAPCTSPSRSVTVNVNTPVAITLQPVSASLCTNKSVSFTAAATGTAIAHNWRVSTNNGVSWTDVANGGVYSGATTTTLLITAPPTSMNGYLYKDSVSTSPCASLNTTSAKLTVNPLPVVTIKAAPLTKLYPGLTTIVSSTVTPNAASTYAWFRNGTQISGTTSSIPVNIDGLGTYSLNVVDVNGCASGSNSIIISDSTSGRVFIYPNPNSGRFQVRYNSNTSGNNPPRGINVFDARGKRVLTNAYSINAPYSRMNIDLTNAGSGVYWVEVVDVNGNRLAIGRVEVLR